MVVLTASSILTRARVAHLEDVVKLNVWGCSLTDMDVVSSCKNLQILSASCNDISSMKELQWCLKLQELYIRENQITDMQEIIHLTKLPNLKVLWLAGNPCCDTFPGDERQYRLHVLKYLPNLERLDNTEVQADEKKEARRLSVTLESAVTVPSVPERTVSDSAVSLGSDANSQPLSNVRNPPPTDHHNSGDISRISSRSGFNESVTESAPSRIRKPTFDETRSEVPVSALYVPSHAAHSDSSVAHGRLRNVNILSAALALVKELDGDSLQLLQLDIDRRLNELQ